MQLQDRQEELAEIWNRTLPATFNDQIVIFVTAIGKIDDRLTENVFARTIYHQEIDGENWSGIQITTAAGVCGVLDLLLSDRLAKRGFVRMEDVNYDDFIENRFGQYYA